tara:strand:+ start:925 stop:1062 length:138 start_codon:yes stop_codon:yes gene_type:complete
MPDIKEILSQFKLEPNEMEAVPYIIGIFLFVFTIVGLVSISYLLF